MLEAPTIIQTDRLLMRQPCVGDVTAIFEYASDPSVVYYMDYPPRADITELEEYLAAHQARWNTDNFSWVLTAKPNDRPIGTIACSIDGHTANFGYLLNQKYWGQGYATEAGRAIVKWALSLPAIYRVWATCDAENAASARVLEKCGLQREGLLRSHTVRPNISPTPRDALIYAKVRSDTESGN